MAEEKYRKRIRKEVTCSICLNYFTRPVELGCMHNFCERCILRCWEESGEETRCPECKWTVEKAFKENRLLTNMAEIISEWDHSKEREAQRRRSECQRHQKTLDLFCQDDEVPFCRDCDTSQGHSGHRVVPVAEAVQDYKDQLCRCLETLKKEKAENLEYNRKAEKTTEDLVKQLMSDRQKMKDEFRQLHSFLEKQEFQLLKQMEEAENEMVRKKNEQLNKLSRELDSLQNSIRELEEKLKQPPSELLQDIRSTLQRHEGRPTFEKAGLFLPEFLWKVVNFNDIRPFLKVVVEQFKEILASGLFLQKASVTLDPDTAHPQLILSEDRRSVRWGEAHQELPDNPERFSGCTFVLGCEEFTAGRHCWEVTMEIEGEWAVGVARKSVGRKGMFKFTPEEGIWGVGHLGSQTWPACRSLRQRIRVIVNHAGRQIVFFDVDIGKVRCFTMAAFSGEPLLPIFYVGPNTCIELPPVTH